KHSKLQDLGLVPHLLSDSLLDSLLNIAIEHRDQIDVDAIRPRVDWRDPKSSTGVSAAAALYDPGSWAALAGAVEGVVAAGQPSTNGNLRDTAMQAAPA